MLMVWARGSDEETGNMYLENGQLVG